MRIAKAIREKRWNKVKSLQWILTHSFYARVIAVKRVTRNKGSRTPGIDGVIWRTSARKMSGTLSLRRRGCKAAPLRRIYISKRNGKLRPSVSPTIFDRSVQALHLLALQPIAETLGDRNSYGFRLFRGVRDAIEQIRRVLNREDRAEWILDADTLRINACFRHSLELRRAGSKINIVRYADDFIVTAKSRELLEDQVIPVLQAFLDERGLRLSLEKTRIVHINDGFDLLGKMIRKFRGRLIIKPAKEAVKRFLADIRETIKKGRGNNAERLVNKLNPKLRGWANQQKTVSAKETFSTVDYHVWNALWRWAKDQYLRKSGKWRRNRHYPDNGSFRTTVKKSDGQRETLKVYCLSSLPLVRCVKIRNDATPFDPAWTDYFKDRRRSSNTIPAKCSNY